jgi:RNA polymerase sigma-70 factor (ECF subfamily)
LATIPAHKDEAFIAQLKARSESAFGQLYDNYSGALYGVLMRMLNNEELAQDALQEGFVKIWKNIDSFDAARGNLFTWMLNIVRNHAIDQLRSKNMKQKIQKLEDSVRSINKSASATIEEDHVLIKELVDKLKPEHRQLIEMAYYQGYTQEELAEELNMPLGTVKTRARAALLQLRKYFEK